MREAPTIKSRSIKISWAARFFAPPNGGVKSKRESAMIRFKHLTPSSDLGSIAADFHRDWIASREQKLARRADIGLSLFHWGVEALEDVPGFSLLSGCPELDTFRKANQTWLQNREEFFVYQTPVEFDLERSQLQFSSPVKSLYVENDTVYAEYFHCSRARGRAVLVLPHWNATPNSYASFCRLLKWH